MSKTTLDGTYILPFKGVSYNLSVTSTHIKYNRVSSLGYQAAHFYVPNANP